jgi:hypothetical protein
MNADSEFFIIAFYKDGFYRIYDGHHRAYCWAQLNQETIQIELIEASDQVLQAVSMYQLSYADTLADLEIVPHYRFKNMMRGLKPE